MTSRCVSIGYLLLTVLLLVIYAGFEDLFMYLVREDFLIEWSTCIAYLAAGCVFFRVFYLKFKSIRWHAWFYLFLAAGCIFVGGEEMSWGQRLFGISTPDVFLEHNFQKEITLHNLGEFGKEWPKRIYMFGVFFYVVAFPVFLKLNSTFRKLSEKLNIVVPPKILMLPFFCSLSFPIFTKLNLWLGLGFDLRVDYVLEVTEMFSGFLFLHFSIFANQNQTNRE